MQIDWTAYAKRAGRPLSARGTVETRWRDRGAVGRTTVHGAELTADLALCAVEAQFADIGRRWQVVHRVTGLQVARGGNPRQVRALLLALQEAGVNWPGCTDAGPATQEDRARARDVILSWREWAGVGA